MTTRGCFILAMVGCVMALIGDAAPAQPPISAPAVNPKRSGQVSIRLTPDRQTWHFRETITGRVEAKNTGDAPVKFPLDWATWIEAKDEHGREPKAFFVEGCILYGPGPRDFDLGAGESRETRFTLYADRVHSMQHGLYLTPGRWRLACSPAANAKVTCDPADINVFVDADEYTGPRLERVVPAGSNLVLFRESGCLEVVEAATAHRLASHTRMLPSAFWQELPISSGDGRLLAINDRADSSIRIVPLFGDRSGRATIDAPAGVRLGPGGFVVRSFSPDNSQLFCATNNELVHIDRASGGAVRVVHLAAMWPRISPDGLFAVDVRGSLARLVGNRGRDTYTVSVFDLANDGAKWERTIVGHGEAPELKLGQSGAYLCDEFEPAAVFVPFSCEKTREFKTGGTAQLVGESSDGMLAAFASPWSDHRTNPTPTTLLVFRVADGTQVCRITTDAPCSAVLVSDPPRLVALRHDALGNRGGIPRLLEKATVYSATTGAAIHELDLTPAKGTFPEVWTE